MIRNVIVSLAVALTPAVVVAVPLPSEALRKPILLIDGTTFAGDGAVAFTVYNFEQGGVLSYSYKGSTWRNGTWKQSGTEITFQCNNGYYEFKGTIDGEEITGQSWNQAGGKWTIKMKRQQPTEK